MECALVWSAMEQKLPVEHRSDVYPVALLGVQIITASASDPSPGNTPGLSWCDERSGAAGWLAACLFFVTQAINLSMALVKPAASSLTAIAAWLLMPSFSRSLSRFAMVASASAVVDLARPLKRPWLAPASSSLSFFLVLHLIAGRGDRHPGRRATSLPQAAAVCGGRETPPLTGR